MFWRLLIFQKKFRPRTPQLAQSFNNTRRDTADTADGIGGDTPG